MAPWRQLNENIMKFVKAKGTEQTLRYDSRTTIVVPLEGITVSDPVAAALESRCAVEVSDAPESEEIFTPDPVAPAVIPDAAKEPAPVPQQTDVIPTPTVEDLIKENNLVE